MSGYCKMGVTKDDLMKVMTTLELDHLKALMRESHMRWLELLMEQTKAALLDYHLN